MTDASTDRASGDAMTDALQAGADATTGDGASADAEQSDVPVLPMAAPTTVLLRVANWSPDSPAVDACIARHGTGAFSGPIVAALETALEADDAGASLESADGGPPGIGLAFPLVSSYIELAPAQYDVRIVVAGATSCATGIGNDATALPSLAAGAAETVALVGEANPIGGDAPLAIVGFLDDVTSSAAVAVRFVNAAPALSEVDVGTGSLATMKFKALFDAVPFGQRDKASEVPPSDASPPSVDSNGYLSMKTLSNVTLSAHAPAATTDAVAYSGLSAASGSILTIAIVGDTSSGVPASLLECVDNAGSVTELSNCSLLTTL